METLAVHEVDSVEAPAAETLAAELQRTQVLVAVLTREAVSAVLVVVAAVVRAQAVAVPQLAHSVVEAAVP